MPRRPTRYRRLLKPRPLTFSSFSRSAAQVASSYLAKRRMQDSKLHRESPLNSADNRILRDTLGKRSEPSESSDEEEFDGNVQADFAFFDPKSNDFHGVKTMLQAYLDNKQWDLNGFIDLILGQTTVGTVVKIEGDEDEGVFSIVTALNLGRYKDHKCIMEIKEFLLKACQEKDVVDDLRLILGEQAQNVGLLVSQRVVNLPPQLLPPLYDALFDEVSWATEDEHKNADQKMKLSNDIDEAIIYTKPEDEIFHRLSQWSFSFPLHTQQPTHELRNYRFMGLVMAVEAEKISTFRQELKSLINES
ncbi:protein BCCIP homolog isoform X2 [Quercus robur]|uniref:protein BCCIP homolog isoform X2 n=1 Tax=Quercus robur TaxID=38942 RepID=UPI002162B95B|nr:protein BCCIP homolog isoform X2 [Quercus robur]